MTAAVLIALAILPLVVLRGRTLLTCYLTEAALALFAWLVGRRMPSFDPRVGLALLAVGSVALLLLFLARGAHVRWSANRGAVLAAVIYALMIPAMTRVPIDGDEPFYLLVTESIVRDLDVDLSNQYRRLDLTASGRTDLAPQYGDPVSADGKQYSRHEPFLPLLMAPGYLFGGLHGAIATIALFGVLLVRSTLRLLEDEGISEATTRAVFPFFAFAPPVLFYATRIWPEVPAAFCFVEALRGMRNHRPKRWIPALFGLVMLKLRFVLVAVGLVVAGLRGSRIAKRRGVVLAMLAAAPMLLLWAMVGNPLSVHSWRELLPAHPESYIHGLFGLLVDGAAGIAFQAPFYLLALIALTRWREMPGAFRHGVLASLLYLIYLLPRDEWHGGWSPPLRYIVFLMPVLALGCAAVWERVSRGAIALVALWTIGLIVHVLVWPWRLFHIANGENAAGEWLGWAYRTDFSRLFPSFIRVNDAAWVASALLIVLLVVIRFVRIPSAATTSAVALGIAVAFVAGRQPARTIHFEDAHVVHEGGELYPHEYAIMRFAYRGGWTLHAGQSLTFLARQGAYTLHYVTGPGATIDLGGNVYVLPPTDGYLTAQVVVPRTGRVTLRCTAGAVNLERMDHE